MKPRHGPIVVSKEAVPILTEQLAEVSPDVARRVAEGAKKPAKRGSDAGRVLYFSRRIVILFSDPNCYWVFFI